MSNPLPVIIIPVFNENLRAIKTIELVLKHCLSPILVIDDGSIDNTFQLLTKHYAKNKRIVLWQNLSNLGKGESMTIAVQLAFHHWQSAKAVIFLDGDGQHHPKFIPQFTKALAKNDLVFGYRELKDNVPLVRKYGNYIAKKMVGLLFNIKRKDLLCGYFGFSKQIYPQIKWQSKRYGVETEIASKVGKLGLKFTEIKVNTTYIDKYKGVNLWDAFKILLKIPGWYIT